MLANVEQYGEHSVMAACVSLASLLAQQHKGAATVQLAEKLLAARKQFSDQSLFTDSLNAVLSSTLKARQFGAAEGMLKQLGLPCDPNVCLS